MRGQPCLWIPWVLACSFDLVSYCLRSVLQLPFILLWLFHERCPTHCFLLGVWIPW
uniref:Uncharacterized protein n=1 Tax=Setaria italica TaxID=4555 RepID=K3Y2Y6_SETIT